MFFGSKQGNKKRQKDLQDILANARILTTIPDDIDLEIWKKFFMISTAATITSYFNETIGEVVNNHIDLFITLGYELKSVAEAKGIRLPDGQVFSAIDAQKIMPNRSGNIDRLCRTNCPRIGNRSSDLSIHVQRVDRISLSGGGLISQ